MASIFTFLSDQYQHQLKIQAIAGRFEKTMLNYTNSFFSKLENLDAIQDCPELNPKLKSFSSDNKTNLFSWLKCMEDTILNDKEDCKQFCFDLVKIYNLFLSGKQTQSSLELYQLMIDHDLFDSVDNFAKSYPITFRGRFNKNEKSKDIEPEYFYHVPFDRLSYVKNYRFSITGQPFIYLGASIPTVILELRAKLDAFSDIELSMWALKQTESLKIYDISNSFYDLINLNMIAIFEAGSGVKCEQIELTPNVTTFLVDFKKFILSQFCTFKKIDIIGQVFVEQYVIPQLLTEQIRNYDKIKYDGFVFPSTQYADKVTSKENDKYYGLFKNNIALFTDYSNDSIYDTHLIDKFLISSVNKKSRISISTFYEEMNKILVDNPTNVVLKAKVKVLVDYYKEMLIDGVELVELESVKIQLKSMVNYIKDN